MGLPGLAKRPAVLDPSPRGVFFPVAPTAPSGDR